MPTKLPNAKIPFPELLQQMGKIAEQAGLEVWAVGGVVRDLLLSRDNKADLDFVCLGQGSGVKLAELVAEKFPAGRAQYFPNFGTASVTLRPTKKRPALELEFVGARKESYDRNSRKPIIEAGTLSEDQHRRDFTINAMAFSILPNSFGELLDPFDGQGDLEKQLLRTPLDPMQTFEDDPLRMIRAARFATQLNFEVVPEALAAMKKMAHRIKIVSHERITDEMQKIMLSKQPSIGFKILFTTGILDHFFPELTALAGVETIDGQSHKDNFYHSIQVLDNLVNATKNRDPQETLWLRWASLLHDIAKPRSKRFVKGEGWTFHGHEDRGARMIKGIFRTQKLPLDERMKYVQKLVQLHHRPVALVNDIVTDSAVRRLLFDAGDEIDDLMTLVRADITSKNPQRVKKYLRHFDSVEKKMIELEEKDRIRNFQPPISGQEIIEKLNIPPCKVVGMIKDQIKDAILDGEIENNHEAAFDYMMQIQEGLIKENAHLIRRRGESK